MFVHIRGHSTYSLLEGIGLTSKVLDKAEELGMTSIGLTEYYFFSGMVEFYQKALKKKINPIIGIELGFLPDTNYILQQRYIGNIVLIAKNKTGYYNLMKLITQAWKYKKEDKPCIDFEILKKYKDGLYVLIGGEKSVFGQMLLQNENPKKISDLMEEIIGIVGQDNFLVDLIAQDYKTIPNLKKINSEIKIFAESKGINILINNNFHYVNQEDKKYMETALAIKDGKKMYDEDRRKIIGEYHIMSEEEILNIMLQNGFEQKYIQKLINNNVEIAKGIKTEIDLYQKLFPKYQTPENIKDLYSKYKENLIEK